MEGPNCPALIQKRHVMNRGHQLTCFDPKTSLPFINGFQCLTSARFGLKMSVSGTLLLMVDAVHLPHSSSFHVLRYCSRHRYCFGLNRLFILLDILRYGRIASLIMKLAGGIYLRKDRLPKSDLFLLQAKNE